MVNHDVGTAHGRSFGFLEYFVLVLGLGLFVRPLRVPDVGHMNLLQIALTCTAGDVERDHGIAD